MGKIRCLGDWRLRTPEALLSAYAEKVTVDPVTIVNYHNAEAQAGGGESGYQASPNLLAKKRK